ncbi:MAG: glutamate--cysteine ligase [Acidiferrobacterales bacterium]|nr:glutamate--cysteine ligase [Acidiferrobacterales bacterium]
MQTTFEERLDRVHDDAEEIFPNFRRGIEKESLRITPDGRLSQAPHPSALGSALTHPYITTDYSEALMELVTPTFSTLNEVLDYLELLHGIVYHHIDDGLLWVNSLPCLLGDENTIPIAEFGTSNIGKMKHVYRRGLDLRYGRRMQIIAGIHYNISVPDSFWTALGFSESDSRENEISNAYMAATRNFHRYCWILFYLFGASPAACRSFFSESDTTGLDELGIHTVYARHGTSLRMSNYGYRNPVQSEIRINQNSVEEYISSLSETISTPFATYEKLGVKSNGQYLQLNTNLLQIENEYYSVVRPKRRIMPMEKPTHALRRRGVEYLEVRCIDLDPYEPTGISPVHARFLDLLITFCLLHPSPPLTDKHYPIISANKDATVMDGLNPDLKLTRNGERVKLKTWGLEILENLQPIARLFDKAHGNDDYMTCVREQKEKLENPQMTPSARILDELITNNEPFFAFAMRKAQEAKRSVTRIALKSATIDEFSRVAAESIQKQEEMEQKDEMEFDKFLEWYFSQ